MKTGWAFSDELLGHVQKMRNGSFQLRLRVNFKVAFNSECHFRVTWFIIFSALAHIHDYKYLFWSFSPLFVFFSSKNHCICSSMLEFLNLFKKLLFIIVPLSNIFKSFFLSYLLHMMLIPQIFCRSVYALWKAMYLSNI